jgi:hypothetical protein
LKQQAGSSNWSGTVREGFAMRGGILRNIPGFTLELRKPSGKNVVKKNIRVTMRGC